MRQQKDDKLDNRSSHIRLIPPIIRIENPKKLF